MVLRVFNWSIILSKPLPTVQNRIAAVSNDVLLDRTMNIFTQSMKWWRQLIYSIKITRSTRKTYTGIWASPYVIRNWKECKMQLLVKLSSETGIRSRSVFTLNRRLGCEYQVECTDNICIHSSSKCEQTGEKKNAGEKNQSALYQLLFVALLKLVLICAVRIVKCTRDRHKSCQYHIYDTIPTNMVLTAFNMQQRTASEREREGEKEKETVTERER